MDWYTPGWIIPYLGFRKLPVHRNGEPVDTGEADIFDERSPFYVQIFAFEWLGFGFPLWPWARVRDAATGKPI